MRARILAAILAATAIGMAAAGVASNLVQRERALTLVDTELMHTVPELRAIAEGKTSGVAPRSVDALLRSAMQQIIPDQNESVLGFLDRRPALVPAVSLPFHIEKDRALVRRILTEANPRDVVRGTAKTPAGTLRYIIVPVRVAGDSHTGLYVAAYNLDPGLAAVSDSFETYLVVALGTLVLVGAVFWFVAGKLLRPIRLLREAAANTESDLSERIPVTGHDDISELARTINRMFDRLDSAFASQRRLIDDVGHELKTPITIVRGHLELLETTDPVEVQATRDLAIDELDRMSTLVAEIALLAESRSPRFVEPSPVDLADFAHAVAAKAVALDPGRRWHVDAPSDVAVHVDTRRLTQAWLQLAANAAKYSTPALPITLSAALVQSRSTDWLHLDVTDAGPGIPEEAQAGIFERFARLENGRGNDGSGLGLAIVSAIAQAHGGTVLVDSAPGRGSTFTIRVPAGAGAAQSEQFERNE